jgi:hypothetical protein
MIVGKELLNAIVKCITLKTYNILEQHIIDVT